MRKVGKRLREDETEAHARYDVTTELRKPGLRSTGPEQFSNAAAATAAVHDARTAADAWTNCDHYATASGQFGIHNREELFVSSGRINCCSSTFDCEL